MEIIGFSFTNIQGIRNKNFKLPFATNININFDEVEKQKIEIVKEKEIATTSFKCSLAYNEPPQEQNNSSEKQKEKEQKSNNIMAEIKLEGNLTLSLDKEEAKELFKAWKKKEMPEKFREPLFNVIWRKCLLRALTMEDELNLPPHINLPRIKLQ